MHAVRERVDRVWVPSAFVRDGYVAGGMPPGIVDVVPNGVDLERFMPDGSGTRARRAREPRPRCTFLFVGGTIWRKGIDVLLAAWARAFGPDDDVRLVVKDFGVETSYKGQTPGAEVRALAARDDVAPVTYLTEDLPAAELPALYRAADVVVLPYRAEGFCLPALEAMACGVPVIHTAAGPTGEFCPPDAGWALPARAASSRRARTPARRPDRPARWRSTPTCSRSRCAPPRRPARTRAPSAGQHARRAAERMSWDAAAEIAEQRLVELTRCAPPRWARAIVPPQLETRGTAVLYAPDWDAPADVAAGAARMGRDALAPTTTRRSCWPRRAASATRSRRRALAALEASGRPADALPDVLLDDPPADRLDGLVARCDAILLDDAGASGRGRRAELLTRRSAAHALRRTRRRSRHSRAAARRRARAGSPPERRAPRPGEWPGRSVSLAPRRDGGRSGERSGGPWAEASPCDRRKCNSLVGISTTSVLVCEIGCAGSGRRRIDRARLGGRPAWRAATATSRRRRSASAPTCTRTTSARSSAA